jgi:hypothetical protein
MEHDATSALSEATPLNGEGPLSAEDLAAYLDGTLDSQDRERVESVLASNPEARAELIEASRLVTTLPSTSPARRRPWGLISVAAVAAVGILAIGPTLLRKPATVPVATERRVPIEEATRIRVASPAEGAVVDGSSVRFTWNAVSGATYQLTLTNAEGGAVWQATTADTSLAIPADVKLSPSSSYYWNVDALAADGSSTTSGIKSFTTGAK